MLNRRELLLSALAIGAVSALPGCSTQGRTKMIRAMPEPAEMPDYMSVFQYMGEAAINGQPVNIESRIKNGDVIETGPDSEVVFVLDKDAWQLQPNTRIRLPKKMMGGTYHLEAGGALGVFSSRQIFVSTPDAVVGIRGTGIYAEVEASRTYFCTCYGETEIIARADDSIREVIVSKHHDAPRYITRNPSAPLIQPAPFKNHEDKELSMIETLVGREMPPH